MLDDFYNGTNTYLRHVTDLCDSSPFEETIQYADNILVFSQKYINNEITIEEFDQSVAHIEEDEFTALEIKTLNHIRRMLIACMPVDRSS